MFFSQVLYVFPKFFTFFIIENGSEGSGSSGRDLEIVRVVEPTLANSVEIFEAILEGNIWRWPNSPIDISVHWATSNYPSKLKSADLATPRTEYRIPDSVGLILSGL